jgi:hypothetical protein
MTELLQLAQLVERDHVADVQIRSGGVATELDAERPSLRELRYEVLLRVKVHCMGAEALELAIDRGIHAG